MPYLADRVQETTTTTGTGAVTLGGAVASYRSFADGFAEHRPCFIEYLLVSGNNWEVGRGFLDAAGTTLLRTNPKSSSAGEGALINLTGTSNVFCTVGAEILDGATIGAQVAQSNGLAMP